MQIAGVSHCARNVIIAHFGSFEKKSQLLYFSEKKNRQSIAIKDSCESAFFNLTKFFSSFFYLKMIRNSRKLSIIRESCDLPAPLFNTNRNLWHFLVMFYVFNPVICIFAVQTKYTVKKCFNLWGFGFKKFLKISMQ